MDLLEKQLKNKEGQFREMSAQLLIHLNKISKLTNSVQALRSQNVDLQSKISEKDEILESILSEKSVLYEQLHSLESPVAYIPPTASTPQSSTEEEKEKLQLSVADLHDIDPTPTPEEESKEESYISNEIDITAELEKLGLVDLIKKY